MIAKETLSRRKIARSLGGHDGGDALAGVAIPKRRDCSLLLFSGENGGKLGLQFLGIAPDQNIRSECHRDGPFRVLAKGETRHAEVCGLFLNATRIGNNDLRSGLKPEEIHIRQRIQQAQLVGLQAKIGNALPGPRVSGKNDGNVAIHRQQRLEDALERRAVINVGWARRVTST